LIESFVLFVSFVVSSISHPPDFGSPILENLVELSTILFRNFFLGLVVPARLGFLCSPRNPRRRFRRTSLVEQLGDVAPEEPDEERKNPDNDRGENEEKKGF
jgi:hypothetical protein